MLWKCILCLSVLVVVTSEEVEQRIEIENVANEMLRKFNEEHGLKLKEIAQAWKDRPKAQEANINEYIEELLKELNYFIIKQRMDPVTMPDIKENFEWRVGFIKYKGLMHLTNGQLKGLSTMDRYGDVIVSYEYPNIKIRLPLGYNVLTFNYKYKAKFMGLGPRGKLDGSSVKCRFTIDMDINLITLMAKLNRFNLHTVGTISLKFSGNILTDWIANVFVTVTIPFIKPILNIIISDFVNDGIRAVFGVYNGFICSLLGNCLL